jgi:hypothetical protein
MKCISVLEMVGAFTVQNDIQIMATIYRRYSPNYWKYSVIFVKLSVLILIRNVLPRISCAEAGIIRSPNTLDREASGKENLRQYFTLHHQYGCLKSRGVLSLSDLNTSFASVCDLSNLDNLGKRFLVRNISKRRFDRTSSFVSRNGSKTKN